MNMCDFCSSNEPKWEYKATSFAMPDVSWESVGSWAACNVCNILIQTEQWDKLLEHSLDTSIDCRLVTNPIDRAILRNAVAQLHLKFRGHLMSLTPTRLTQ